MVESKQTLLTPEQFAHLGDGAVAYVKPIMSDEVTALFPDAPAIQPGLKLFALYSAHGAPIVVTQSRDAAIANAMENELHTLSLH